MHIMTANGWMPLYEPKPTYNVVGITNTNHPDIIREKRSTIRFTFEQMRGSREQVEQYIATRDKRLTYSYHLA
jgi:hypothetical protein